MTETDLRFAFHMDTASFPFWSEDEWQTKVLYRGHLTSEYGRWLEERAGNPQELQRIYQFKNQRSPTYQSKRKSWYRKGWNKYYNWQIRNVYSVNYIYWLEERILKNKPEVISEILHI